MGDNINPIQARTEKNYYKPSVIISIAAAIVLLCMTFAYSHMFTNNIGPEQPIPFSHRVHTTDKQISCYFCHSQAIDTDNAGIPPLETCMLCHNKIIIHHPEIVKLREYYNNRIPVPWQRVNVLQEFTFFSHQPHIQSGIDCGKCHGDVKQMDRIVMKKKFEMGFCVQCHRDTKVSHDCLRCHR
jgi:hypothetical protein